jgi:hypothetical protein
MFSFMSLGVLGEYTKSLFPSSPCMHRFFVRIFRILGDDFMYRKQAYIRRILHIWLNTFRVFYEYAELKKGYAERNFHFQQCLGILKAQYFVTFN